MKEEKQEKINAFVSDIEDVKKKHGFHYTVLAALHNDNYGFTLYNGKPEQLIGLLCEGMIRSDNLFMLIANAVEITKQKRLEKTKDKIN